MRKPSFHLSLINRVEQSRGETLYCKADLATPGREEASAGDVYRASQLGGFAHRGINLDPGHEREKRCAFSFPV